MKMINNQLQDKEFNLFRELIYIEAGIKLSEMKKALLQSRLSRRCKALHIDTFKDYYNYLQTNLEAEKVNFINALTTNKTDFFRENRHFEYMKEVYLPQFEVLGKRDLKVWSAASSSGEEAYSIAMTILNYYENKKKPNVKILATDIDTHVLEKGETGVYRQESVENIDIDTIKKYFARGGGDKSGLFKVKKQIRDMVYFRRLNLLGNRYPMKGKFDIIFCRNVIIYFDKDTQRHIFKMLYQYLEDHGILFIGHSENITAVSDFKFLGNTIYCKDM